jgi:glycopeptide antibiotics resistance protein
MKIRRAKVALVGFIGLLIALVVLADSGSGQWLFSLAAFLPAGDKLGHVILFGILSFLTNLLARGQTMRFLGRPALKWNVILMVVVTLEECSQLFFRSRSFDLLDLSSDALGIWLFGRLAVAYLTRKRKARPTPTASPTVG